MSNKKIPEDFFKKLPDRILDRIDREAYTQELSEHSKVLATLPKYNPYRVPQNYFERLANKKIVNPRVLKMWTGIISIAATLLIMVLMTIGNDIESDIVLTNEDILAYYEDNAEEVEPYMLSDLFVMNEEEILIEDYMIEEIISDLSDEELELLNQKL
jgi:hypothetical protein